MVNRPNHQIYGNYIYVNCQEKDAVKTARVAYISGLKPLSFTLTEFLINFVSDQVDRSQNTATAIQNLAKAANNHE